jgi:hypothetical protein
MAVARAPYIPPYNPHPANTQIMATSHLSLSIFRISVRQVEKLSVRYISELEMGREGPIQRGQILYSLVFLSDFVHSSVCILISENQRWAARK